MKTRTNVILAILSVLCLVGLGLFFNSSLRRTSSDMTTAWQEHESATFKLDARLQVLADRIKTLQGTNQCGANEDCRIVGIGVPICGLYKNFVIYSVKDADEAPLLRTIAEFGEAYRKITNLSTSTGDCGVHPSPIQCIGGRCAPVQR